MGDLVERLRKAAKFGGHYAEAAEEIERLREENLEFRTEIEGLQDIASQIKYD